MKKLILIALMMCLAVFLTEASDFEELKVKETSTIEKTLSFSGSGARSLELDNVFGAILVEGYDGETVKLSATKTIRALSKEKLAKAKKEVKLDISTKGNTIRIYVDGPFRDKDKETHWKLKEIGYIVQYDFRLKVPHHTALSVKTITEGDVQVTDIIGKCNIGNVNGKIQAANLEGDFDIHTVNGGIKVNGISGSGDVHTVNGKVVVDFDKNPTGSCSFQTVNGKLDISFKAGLSADFKLKTFHGGINSDFPFTYLPGYPVKGKKNNGKYVYKSNRSQAIRIGKGGPTIEMETLNGGIYINKK